MTIVERANGTIGAHMLALVRRRGALMPPYFFSQGRIYGEGEYENETEKEVFFDKMLTAITQKFKKKLCLYIEFSDVSKKMFGYRIFRQNNYFPVPWQEVKNSLHSTKPEDRLSEKTKRRIENSYNSGVTTREINGKSELHDFYILLHKFYKFKFRRFLPPEKFITEIEAMEKGKIFVTIYNNKIIGGCTCVYSGGSAYLWHLASKRKSYLHLHPMMMTVWQAIKYAYENNYAHISFIDVGLPFRKNMYREFILSFGGKPIAKYRWFKFSFPWINNILSWIYRE